MYLSLWEYIEYKEKEEYRIILKKLNVWKKKVRERDGNKCVKSGTTEKLEIHHIKSYTLYPEFRTRISNGKTLCSSCHKKTRYHGHKIRKHPLYKDHNQYLINKYIKEWKDLNNPNKQFMRSKKQWLNDILDIGGVFTFGNLYSLDCASLKDSRRIAERLKKYWLEHKLVKPLDDTRTWVLDNAWNQEFFTITLEGCKFLERGDEYKNITCKAVSTDRIRHESYKIDVLLSLVRLYRDYKFYITYPISLGGRRPDALIFMKHRTIDKQYNFILEIERKKTISRTFKETVYPYLSINKKDKSIPRKYKVLVVFSDKDSYPDFYRPQMTGVRDRIFRTFDLTRKLASHEKYGQQLPNYFLFMPQSDFYRLNEAVWFNNQGLLTKLIN